MASRGREVEPTREEATPTLEQDTTVDGLTRVLAGLLPATLSGDFLAGLRLDLERMVTDELRTLGASGRDCPWIELYLDRYGQQPAPVVATFLRRYVGPAVDEARTPQELRRHIVERVRVGVRAWHRNGGSLAGAIPELGALPAVRPTSPHAEAFAMLARLDDGAHLPSGVRRRFERAFGLSLDHIRLHDDAHAAALAQEQGAAGFAVGAHVVVRNGPAHGTVARDALLAHELAHTLEQRPGEGTGEPHTNRAALAALSGRRPARGAGGLRLSRCSYLSGPTPHARELGEADVPARADVATPPAASTLPSFTAPGPVGPSLGERLSSSDDVVRRTAIAELTRLSGEPGWRAAVLASGSERADVRVAAEQLVAGWLGDSAFATWLAALPTAGEGQLGDLAVRLLTQGGRPIDLESYRAVLRQELTLVRAYRRELVDARSASTSSVADTSFGELERGLSATNALTLAETGRMISRLLERFTLLRAEFVRLELLRTASSAGPLATVLDDFRQRVLDAAFFVTSAEDDARFADVLQHLRDVPIAMAREAVTQLASQVNDARTTLRPLTTAGRSDPAGQRLAAMAARLVPDLDALATRITGWQAAVDAHPLAVLRDLGTIRPTLDSLLTRARLARLATAADSAATEVDRVTPHISTAAPSYAFESSAAPPIDFSTTNVDWWQSLTTDFRRHRDNFALLGERYELNPEVASTRAAEETDALRTTGRSAEAYVSTQNALFQLDLLGLEVTLGLAVLIAAAYTGGVAGELAAGGIEVLGGSAWLMTAGSVLVEGSAFYFTQRGLDWALHLGNRPFLPEHWGRDLALSIGAVGLLRGAGGLFDALAGARPPTAGLAAGRFAASYATLLTYSSFVEPLIRGEPVHGITTSEFWLGAGETLLTMGVMHVSLAAMRPLTLRITEPLLNARIAAHNARAEALGTDLESTLGGEADAWRARMLTRRGRALLQERIRLLREIAARDPAQLTQTEFTALEGLLQTRIELADSVLMLDQLRVRPLSLGVNTFGYEGSFETARQHFTSRGFTVRAEDPTTGLLRLVDPAGHEMSLLRLHAGASGADPSRMPTEVDLLLSRGPGEVSRRASLAYETIRELQDDVPAIARNVGVPERVLGAVREHLFLRLHDLAIAPGRTTRQRFDPLYSIARLWMRAYENQLSPAETNEFRRLLAHEYVEQALMQAGMPYRSAAPASWSGGINRATPESFGAHDLAPIEELTADPFGARVRLGVSATGAPRPGEGEAWDFDATVRNTFEALRAREDAPYRVVIDTSAPHGYRVELADPTLLGTSGAAPGPRTTGADAAWVPESAGYRALGLSTTEADSLVALLRAAGRIPGGTPVLNSLTADQLRQLLGLDAAGLARVLALPNEVLQRGLAFTTVTGDADGGRALDALVRAFGTTTLEAIVDEELPTGLPTRNQRLLGGLGRGYLSALAEGATPEAVGADAIVIDNNAWTSLRLLLSGTPWRATTPGEPELQDGQRRTVNSLLRMAGRPELTADPPTRTLPGLFGTTRLLLPPTALAESRALAGTSRRGLLTTDAHDSPVFNELLQMLNTAPPPSGPATDRSTTTPPGPSPLGGDSGYRDRAVVADVLLASGGPARFLTFDADVYGRLYGWNVSPPDPGLARQNGEGLRAYIQRAHRSTQSFRVRIALPVSGRTVEATICPTDLW
ncbi:MAG: eCIS core domain-containing protein [Myxococcota bacterium]